MLELSVVDYALLTDRVQERAMLDVGRSIEAYLMADYLFGPESIKERWPSPCYCITTKARTRYVWEKRSSYHHPSAV